MLNIDMSWGLMIYLSQTDGFIFSGLEYWWLILTCWSYLLLFLLVAFILVGRGLDDVFQSSFKETVISSKDILVVDNLNMHYETLEGKCDGRK